MVPFIKQLRDNPEGRNTIFDWQHISLFFIVFLLLQIAESSAARSLVVELGISTTWNMEFYVSFKQKVNLQHLVYNSLKCFMVANDTGLH